MSHETRNPARKGGETLETIQILRAAAVIAVVVSHTMHELARLLEGNVVAFNEKAFPGDFGVDLFFVISGFIMVYVSREAFAQPGAVASFIKRRLIRIVPLYWLMTTAMIAVIVILPDNVHTATRDPMQWISSYLFIPHERMTDGLMRPVLGLGWSLEYEMFFYCLFALGLLLPMRRGLVLTGALIVLVWTAGLLWAQASPVLYFLSRPVIFEFAAGLVLGCCYLAGARLSPVLALTFVTAGIAILFADPAFDAGVEAERHVLYGFPAVLMVAGATMFRGVGEYRAGRLWLSAGDASYSTYLVHPFVLGGLAIAGREIQRAGLLTPEIFFATFVLVAIMASLAAGYLVNAFVDMPMREALQRSLSGTGKSAVKPA